MKSLLLILVLSVASARLFHYQENMDLEAKSWFVMFAASWCQHCQKIKPQFLQAAVKSEFRFLLVDCETVPEFCKAWGVKKYPTFKIITGTEELEYTGGKNFQDFIDYVTKAGKPAVTEIDSNEYQNITGKQEVSFTLLYSDETLKKTFEIVADKYKHTHLWFYSLRSDSNQLLVTGSDSYLQYSLSNISSKSVDKFITLHYFPTIIEMQGFNMAKLSDKNRHKKLAILIVEPQDLENSDLIKDYEKLAYEYRLNSIDSIQFLVLRGNEYEDKIEAYELKELPALIVSELKEDTIHYSKLEGADLKNRILSFMHGVHKGDISLSELSPSYTFYILSFFRKLSTVEFWLDKIVYIVPFIVIVISIIGSLVAISGMNSADSQKEKSD